VWDVLVGEWSSSLGWDRLAVGFWFFVFDGLYGLEMSFSDVSCGILLAVYEFSSKEPMICSRLSF
jgi:hypothetical protein